MPKMHAFHGKAFINKNAIGKSYIYNDIIIEGKIQSTYARLQ